MIYFGHRGIVTSLISILLARLLGKRTFMWGHAFRQDRTGLRGLSNIWFQKLAHGLLLIGNRARQIALSRGFRPENLYVVFNSLDHDAQKALRQQVGPEQTDQVRTEYLQHPQWPLLVATSRLDPRKKLHMLIDAVNSSDWPVINALTFVGAIIYLGALLLTDFCYALVDPRVSLK